MRLRFGQIKGGPLSVARKFPASPMMIFTRREHALDVAVQRSHDADAREHCRATASHEHQRFDRSLPLWQCPFFFGQRSYVGSGVA
jgi:hypothetical protein